MAGETVGFRPQPFNCRRLTAAFPPCFVHAQVRNVFVEETTVESKQDIEFEERILLFTRLDQSLHLTYRTFASFPIEVQQPVRFGTAVTQRRLSVSWQLVDFLKLPTPLEKVFRHCKSLVCAVSRYTIDLRGL
jgi:hypothetical protein